MIAELAKTFHQTLIADLQTGADAFGGAWLASWSEQSQDLIRKRVARHSLESMGYQSQIRPWFPLGQFQRKRPSARGRTMFGGKHQLAVVLA